MGKRESRAPVLNHGNRVTNVERMETNLRKRLRPRGTYFHSFKNRILISTLLVLIGCVIVIGATLQLFVFPQLRGDLGIILNLKIIHLFASLLVIAISVIFIEIISKRITRPLRELTERADQISREAGKSLAPGPFGDDWPPEKEETTEEHVTRGDEIDQLQTSFYRMLAHLRASEAHLRESEEKYRFLFDNQPSPLFVLDVDGLKILDVNAQAAGEYQYSRAEFLTMGFCDLRPPQEGEDSDTLMRQLIESDVCLLPVIKHMRKDGSVLMVQLQARMTHWKDRQALMVAVWDVTEKLEHEARMAQTAKMATLGEMATGIAHELNQPLNVIKLASDFVQKNIRRGRTIPPEELNRAAIELSTNVDRAARIINHLREFGRKAEAAMTPLNVNAPVRGAFTLIGTQLKKSGITCELALDENLPDILGDENRLEQVFLNLVTNARDAMLEEEKKNKTKGIAREKILEIRTFEESGRVVVTVSDTGPGIPRALRDRIFEPFFTTKKVGEGTGLGLSISYGIIKEHQGTIEIDGPKTGGSTFRMTFPILDRSSETTHVENTGN